MKTKLLLIFASIVLGFALVSCNRESSSSKDTSTPKNTFTSTDLDGSWKGRGSNSEGDKDGVVINFNIRDDVVQSVYMDFWYTSNKECTIAGRFVIPVGTFSAVKSDSSKPKKPVFSELTIVNGTFVGKKEEQQGIGSEVTILRGQASDGTNFSGEFKFSNPCVDITIPWTAKKISTENHDSVNDRS